MNDNSFRVIEIDINDILPNRFQPRIQFDEEEILELSDSIKEHGVIQPIVVRTIGDKYEIIAGERRYKASVLAGKETVPVIIKNLNDKESAEVALIENVQRKNLTPIEEALSYKKILDMGYITQEDLAAKLGKSQPSVANKIRLLNLSDEVQEALLENKISERHARSLLRLHSSKKQNEMLQRIVTERLTVRKADEEIDKLKNNEEGTDDNIQKVIEKGEISMNNNLNEMPTQVPNFDIFGTPNTQNNQQTVVQPQVQPQMSQPNFDIFGTNQPSSTPVQEVTSVPVMPQVQPIVEPVATVEQAPNMQMPAMEAPVVPMVGMQFDANGVVTQTPSMEMPAMEAPVVPMGGMQFDANGVVTQAPSMQMPAMEVPVAPMGAMQFDANGVVTEAPSMQIPTVEAPISQEMAVPETAPIIEQPIVNPENIQAEPTSYSFGPTETENLDSTQNASEFKMPEPIIITDYNKQYDPIMPQTEANINPTVDFKEVINAIRECSSKIEKFGYKIDVEEYDLANLYQVIFKIDK